MFNVRAYGFIFAFALFFGVKIMSENKRDWLIFFIAVIGMAVIFTADYTERELTLGIFVMPVFMLGAFIIPTLMRIYKRCKKQMCSETQNLQTVGANCVRP
jgi:hypothetical protein